MAKHRKKRIPKLSHTTNRELGFYVSYRDPATGTPKKHVFGNISADEANQAYNEWVAAYLTGGKLPKKPSSTTKRRTTRAASTAPTEIVPGCLLQIVGGIFSHDDARLRSTGELRRKGTISQKRFDERRSSAKAFLAFLNERHGTGASARIKGSGLTMEDVEKYNLQLVKAESSESHVSKCMGMVKEIINTAGRPEFGGQVLSWNWDSRRKYSGLPTQPKKLPTVRQLKLLLSKCDVNRCCQVWMAIGLGFGQGDLSVAQPEHFDRESYDMRRGKTGEKWDRYGEMPPLVWKCLQDYLAKVPRGEGELLFVTEQGKPLVHGRSDSVVQWWDELRKSLNGDGEELSTFYVLRHLGATEFGSRPGCSISDMRRFLGHSTSSAVADKYMKPVAPEYKEVVAWVRAALQSTDVDLTVED